MATLKTKTGRILDFSKPKNILQTAPVQSSVSPAPVTNTPTATTYTPGTSIDNRPVATTSGNPYMAYSQRKNTLATRDNPVISVSTVPTPVDINTADTNTLMKEQDAINYKIASGTFTQEDFVRGREINRKLSESMYKTPELQASEYQRELERRAEELKNRNRNPEIEAKRSQLQSQFDTRKAQLEENARRARESTIGNIAMAGGGRSSVAQQAELDIQKELQNQLNAEQRAMDLELLAYQRELEGADSESLQSLYKTIDDLKSQSAQSQMILEQKNKEQIQSSLGEFDKTLQTLAQKQGIKLDVNDEAALQQVINISRNPDGSVNEQVLAGLPREYQALIRAGVISGVGKGLTSAPKVERIGGTARAPIYGYRDGTKFVTTNAQGVPTVRSGGGGMYSGGGVYSGGVGGGGILSGLEGVTAKPTNEGKLALEQALTAKGLTKQQRNDLLAMYSSQGIEGLKTYAYNNLMTAEAKENFNNFRSGGSILSAVGSQIKEGDDFSRWKNISNNALKIVGKGDVGYESVKQQIELAQAPIKNKIYGAALTPSEAEIANRFLVDFGRDDAKTIKMKSKNLAGALRYINDVNSSTILGTKSPDFNKYVNVNDLNNIGSKKTPRGGRGL